MVRMIVHLIQNSFHANVIANKHQIGISQKSMNYDESFWRKYADENESRYNEEFAKFTKDLAISLRCTSVLEIGCGTGIDLRLFPDTFQIHGVDLNEMH